jgi:hypothetical protein
MADEIKNFEPGNPSHINRTPGTTTWLDWLRTNNEAAREKLADGTLTPFESVFVGRDFLLEILNQDNGNSVGIMFWINTHEKDGKEYMTLSLQGVRENGLPYNGVNDPKFMSTLGCPPNCPNWL